MSEEAPTRGAADLNQSSEDEIRRREHDRLGFDPYDTAKFALQFVEKILEFGRVIIPETNLDPKEAWILPVGQCLVEWHHHMNPLGLDFYRFERMDHLWNLGSTVELIHNDHRLRAAFGLNASLCWVLRFFVAQDLCRTRIWYPNYEKMYHLLPWLLVNAVWEYANSLLSGERLKFTPHPSFQPQRNEKSEDILRSASSAVIAVTEIEKILNSICTNNDFWLFVRAGVLRWQDLKLPYSWYDSCYLNSDRIWEDGGVKGLCAHLAVKNLWPMINNHLGGSGVRHRRPGFTNRGSDSCLVPFWDTQARYDAARIVPHLDCERWLLQLRLESEHVRERKLLPQTDLKVKQLGGTNDEAGSLTAGNETKNGDKPPTNPPDEFAELLTFAQDKPLIGKELAVIEALCGSNGTLPLADLAVKKGVDWGNPKQGFKDVQRRLKPKLKRLGWALVRRGNAANLIKLKERKRS